MANRRPARILDQVVGASLLRVHDVEMELSAYTVQEGGKTLEYLTLLRRTTDAVLSKPPLLRIHSACCLSEVFGDDRCDCAWQLRHAISLIAEAPVGLIIYGLSEEGRGTGIINKMRLRVLVETRVLSIAQAFKGGAKPSDRRTFAGAVAILRQLQFAQVQLITNNPAKIEALREAGIEVQAVVPTLIRTRNRRVLEYLRAKRAELGHLIPAV